MPLIPLILFLLTSYLEFTFGDCPEQGPLYISCSTPVVYVIDSTKDVDGSHIDWQFNWLRSTVIPSTAWGFGQRIAFMSYGTGLQFSTNPTSNRSEACHSLDALQNAYNREGSTAVSLTQALKSVKGNYPYASNVVLFSGTSDASNIQEGADYVNSQMSDYSITVISLGSGQFSNFGAVVYTVQDINNLPRNLESCVIQASCGIYNCDLNSSPDSPTAEPSVDVAYQCHWNLATSWNDIMFLLDATDGAPVFNDLYDFVQSVLIDFNVQNSTFNTEKFFTRVGFVAYNSNATLLLKLGDWNGQDIEKHSSLPYTVPPVSSTSDIYDAFSLAVDELGSSRHRSNARKVIVLLATAYNEHGTRDPLEISQQFQRNGGVAIVWNYVAHLEHLSPQLQNLASPGYFLSSMNNTYKDLQVALLDANCFCWTDMISFQDDKIRGYPKAGCYWTRSSTALFGSALNRCLSEFSSPIAKTNSDSKSKFLAQLFNSSFPFWIGLNYTNSQWMWVDGSALGSYQPWLNDVTPSGKDGKQCVYVANDQRTWVADSCSHSYLFNCQLAPCDSTKYCQ